MVAILAMPDHTPCCDRVSDVHLPALEVGGQRMRWLADRSGALGVRAIARA